MQKCKGQDRVNLDAYQTSTIVSKGFANPDINVDIFAILLLCIAIGRVVHLVFGYKTPQMELRAAVIVLGACSFGIIFMILSILEKRYMIYTNGILARFSGGRTKRFFLPFDTLNNVELKRSPTAIFSKRKAIFFRTTNEKTFWLEAKDSEKIYSTILEVYNKYPQEKNTKELAKNPVGDK